MQLKNLVTLTKRSSNSRLSFTKRSPGNLLTPRREEGHGRASGPNRPTDTIQEIDSTEMKEPGQPAIAASLDTWTNLKLGIPAHKNTEKECYTRSLKLRETKPMFRPQCMKFPRFMKREDKRCRLKRRIIGRPRARASAIKVLHLLDLQEKRQEHEEIKSKLIMPVMVKETRPKMSLSAYSRSSWMAKMWKRSKCSKMTIHEWSCRDSASNSIWVTTPREDSLTRS